MVYLALIDVNSVPSVKGFLSYKWLSHSKIKQIDGVVKILSNINFRLHSYL